MIGPATTLSISFPCHQRDEIVVCLTRQSSTKILTVVHINTQASVMFICHLVNVYILDLCISRGREGERESGEG